MELQAKKLDVIQYILLLQDERLISFIEKISKQSLEKEEPANSAPMIWTDYDRMMLAKSFKDSEEGRVIPHAEVMKELRKQLQR